MNEIQTEINEAFMLIDAMSVSGNNQERAALAKAHLKTAYALAEADDKKVAFGTDRAVNGGGNANPATAGEGNEHAAETTEDNKA